ncbi:hypothetical protein D3C78_1577420 [compost metagenome]
MGRRVLLHVVQANQKGNHAVHGGAAEPGGLHDLPHDHAVVVLLRQQREQAEGALQALHAGRGRSLCGHGGLSPACHWFAHIMGIWRIPIVAGRDRR